MRNCVIHRGCIDVASRANFLSPQQKKFVLQAGRDIEAIIKNDPKVVVLDEGDSTLVARFFRRGEEVMLYGGYRDGCLETARQALLKKGVQAYFHPTGSIPIFTIDRRYDR